MLVVLVESLRLVEDSASERERERRRGVQQGVYEGVFGAEKGTGEEMGVGVLMQALLWQEDGTGLKMEKGRRGMKEDKEKGKDEGQGV